MRVLITHQAVPDLSSTALIASRDAIKSGSGFPTRGNNSGYRGKKTVKKEEVIMAEDIHLPRLKIELLISPPITNCAAKFATEQGIMLLIIIKEWATHFRADIHLLS